MVNKVKIIQKLAVVYDNKILVLKRSVSDDSRPGTWDLVGGNVDDEDIVNTKKDLLKEALKREVKEEVGIDLGGVEVESIYVDSGYGRQGGLVIWIGWECKLVRKQDIKISSEHSEYKWVTRSEFVNLDFGFAKNSFANMASKIDI